MRKTPVELHPPGAQVPRRRPSHTSAGDALSRAPRPRRAVLRRRRLPGGPHRCVPRRVVALGRGRRGGRDERAPVADRRGDRQGGGRRRGGRRERATPPSRRRQDPRLARGGGRAEPSTVPRVDRRPRARSEREVRLGAVVRGDRRPAEPEGETPTQSRIVGGSRSRRRPSVRFAADAMRPRAFGPAISPAADSRLGCPTSGAGAPMDGWRASRGRDRTEATARGREASRAAGDSTPRATSVRPCARMSPEISSCRSS